MSRALSPFLTVVFFHGRICSIEAPSSAAAAAAGASASSGTAAVSGASHSVGVDMDLVEDGEDAVSTDEENGEKARSALPDVAVPIGLLANLSLDKQE
jgi:hypothetical protein